MHCILRQGKKRTPPKSARKEYCENLSRKFALSANVEAARQAQHRPERKKLSAPPSGKQQQQGNVEADNDNDLPPFHRNYGKKKNHGKKKTMMMMMMSAGKAAVRI